MPALGLNTGVTNSSLYGAPDILITGFDELGITPHLGRIDTTGHLSETLTYTTGTHQFRFGAEYRRARLDVFYDRNKRGAFSFDGTQTGAALADFLAMRVAPNKASIAFGDLQRNYYLNGTSEFFQDTWKVRRNLTLNYGLNWQYQSPVIDPTNRISTFIPSSGGITYVGQIPNLWPRDMNDFAPRFGFAYQPGSTSKLVVRGGYGIFYQVPNVNYFGDNRPGNGGASGVLANPGGSSPVFTLSNQSALQIQPNVSIFGNVAFPTGPFGAFSVSQQFVDAYVQNANMNLQYQISQSTVFELGYTGSFSRHLPVTADINQLPIGGAARPYAASFPNLATINEIQSVGNGYYNGMVASVRTSSYHGLLAKLNYTYGHSRDDLSATRGAIPQNSYNIRGDYGNADFDIRHSFVGFVSYSLPSPSHAKLLLGGWQLNSLLSFYTGVPLTVLSGTDTSGTKENKDRAAIIGDPFQSLAANKQPNYIYWFNPLAYTAPAQGTYSNQARNQLSGPPTREVDFSIFKNTKINERINTQLRVEIFNIANTLNLSNPGVTLGGGLGQSTSTKDVGNGAPGIGVGAPRNVQLALKIVF
ncbi:MAG TPA: hypothetical protein VK493_15255 [Bryobacteraceae bacterium]|nr:hypothetical protein [Bryobacteraceae bacterium]